MSLRGRGRIICIAAGCAFAVSVLAVSPAVMPARETEVVTETERGRTSAEEFAPLDINTATESELELLPGIGGKLAERIVEYRERHGSFSGVSELDGIEGIGASVLDGVVDYISAGE